MSERISPTDARDALSRVADARRLMAARVVLPHWYRALYALAAMAVFVVPALAVRPHHALPWLVVPIVIVAASVVLGLHTTVLRISSGSRVSSDDIRRFPATRPAFLALVGIVVVGSAATWVAASISWLLALACGLVSAALLCVARSRSVAAVRRDVRAGTAVPR